MEKMLSNIKVIELASVLAGPDVGMFFAEMGAEVIKIENKNLNGDVTRNWKSVNEAKKLLYPPIFLLLTGIKNTSN